LCLQINLLVTNQTPPFEEVSVFIGRRLKKLQKDTQLQVHLEVQFWQIARFWVRMSVDGHESNCSLELNIHLSPEAVLQGAHCQLLGHALAVRSWKMQHGNVQHRCVPLRVRTGTVMTHLHLHPQNIM